MKRIMLISMIMMSLAALSAAETNWEFSRSFTIQAGRDTVASLEITPISAQTENYRIGMPFNIEDTQVQNSVNGVPNLGSGRTIANWSLISNTNFDLTIQAEPLHYTGDQAEADVPSLNYILTFFCNLTLANGHQDAIEFSFDLNGNKCSTNHGVARLESGESIFPTEYASSASNQFYFDLLRGENIGLEQGAFIGSLDGTVSFKFSDDVTQEELASDTYPAGSYEALVYIRLTEKE